MIETLVTVRTFARRVIAALRRDEFPTWESRSLPPSRMVTNIRPVEPRPYDQDDEEAQS